MPLFNLRCPHCYLFKRVFSDNYDFLTLQQRTCKCGYLMRRVVAGPSTSIVERLDNGAMPKAVERYSDAERIFKERHEAADPLAGTKSNRG
jgi:hypothetical protein